jgi:hypothetical protein
LLSSPPESGLAKTVGNEIQFAVTKIKLSIPCDNNASHLLNNKEERIGEWQKREIHHLLSWSRGS